MWIRDTNGNYISIAYVSGHDQSIYQISDSLGRVVTFNYDSSNRLTSLSQFVHPSGSKTYVTFSWGAPYSSGYTWYSFSGLTVNGFPTAAQMNVLTGCTYPNGTGYRFTYGDWGIINKIEQLSSTGATRSYISYDFPAASAGALTDAPAYQHQTISPDGGTSNNSVWTYSTTKDSTTGAVTSMAVTDPLGTVNTTNVDASTGLTSSVQVKNSSGTVLRAVNYTWVTNGFNGATVPDTITTTNDAGQQSKIQYGYDTYYGQVTDVYEYDFGLSLKRHTVTTYLNGANTNPNPHIFNLPTQVLVKDSSGNTISRTDMAYDGNSLTLVTGALSHDDISYGTSATVRGNLTSVTRYSNASAGTGAVARNFYYDTLGNLITAQLDCCNQMTFAFTATTQYSQPDSVTRGPSGGPQFTSGFTYDPDNSLLLANTDENGQITQYQYDSMGRTVQVTLPPQNGTQVQLTTAYADDLVTPMEASSSTANSAVNVAAFDGLGHVTKVDNKNGSTLVSSVKYGYGKLWRRTQSSNPYTPGDTVVNTTISYDALGRVTQVTPLSAGYTQHVYSGNTVTITDPAGKQRKNYTDAVGRLIQVDEPGETFAGTDSSGTLTITGTLLGQTGAGTPATGTVTISGADQSTVVDPCVDFGGSCPRTIWDTGTVSITVNGHTNSANYGQFDTPSTIASNLASAINADSAASVTASASGSVVTVTAKTAGTVGNGYSLSVSSSTNDVPDFGGPSFTGSISGSTLSGGVPGTSNYDSGTVNVTVGSFTASAPYSQSGNSTAAQVATALVGTGSTGLNRAGSPIYATSSGASVSLTYNTPGVAGNVTVTAASNTNDPTHFPGGSFSGSGTLSGGTDPYTNGLTHPYTSTYTYDVLDNLTAVLQAAGNVNGVPVSGQSRTYSFDSLGRVLTANTPESGTTTTYYTNSSGAACSGDAALPCRVQDSRGIVKTFTYDGINRVKSVIYNDGTPIVTYTYDVGGAAAFALGRLTSISEGANSQVFSFDNFGRITSIAQIIDGTTYITSYAYNLASQPTSITYPTGRVVTQGFDTLGRLSSIGSGSTTYLSGLTYNAAGETTGVTLGNLITGVFGYNDHLQISSSRYYKQGNATDPLNLTYDYGTNNNGQLQATRYYTSPGIEDSSKSESYSYDSSGRLSAASTGTVSSSVPGTWSLAWKYDRLGNRLQQNLVGGNTTGTNIGQALFAIDPNTNHITNSGFSYDAAGNMTNDGFSSYVYDGANRLTQINNGAAVYTYFGASRIKKTVGPTTTIYVYSGDKPIVEYLNGIATEYIYDGSALLATLSGNSITYHHPDRLSNRAETDASGNIVRTYGHAPFGETSYEMQTPNKWKFSTYERDSANGETGLDYARFRSYMSPHGRFMSPDLLAGDIGVPQSLNRYSYVQNDPINAGDPTGLDTAWLCWGSKETPGLYQTCIQIDIPPPDSPQDSGSWGDWVTFGAGGGRFGSPSFVLLGPSFGGGGTSIAFRFFHCLQGIRTLSPTSTAAGVKAVLRADASTSSMQAAAGSNWPYLAAIGVRETNFTNVKEHDPGDGKPHLGRGIFQIDIGQNKSVSEAQAFDIPFATQWAANKLASDFNHYANDPHNLSSMTLAEAIHDYNASPYKHGGTANQALAGIPGLNNFTTSHNYVSHVLNLSNCFQLAAGMRLGTH